MEINFIGFSAGLATFLGVWLGHVFVRKIERETVNLWKPALIAVALGVALEIAALLTSSLIVSAVSSIVGVTLLWDAFEFFRQQKRIKQGRAPANLNNPRHVKIMAEYSAASTFDWLDRDPRGSAYSPAELESMKAGAK